MTDSRWPSTLAEWQDAVECADVFLLLDDARLYGLVTGGPVVDADRCRAILEEGRRIWGIVPTQAGQRRLFASMRKAGV